MDAVILDRLFAKRVINSFGCWIWTGAKSSNGYGHIRIGDKHISVHRLSASIFLRDYCESLDVLHICDTVACFNPDHIYMGTNSDNQKDRVKRGKHFETNKTHCKNGHEFTPENTKIRNNGWRVCIKCKRMHEALRHI